MTEEEEKLPPQQRKRKCRCEEEEEESKSSCHGYTCTEILLHPELLQKVHHHGSSSRGISSFSSSTSNNPLLEFCLDGGMAYSCNSKRGETPTKTSFLLFHCSNPHGLDPEKLSRVCQTNDCDINVQNYRGFSALHFIIKGCSKETFTRVIQCLGILLDYGINPNLTDTDGNTALHCLGQMLLPNQDLLEKECVILADLLIRSGCDLNSLNRVGRTVLSYAVAIPNAERVTRLLLDHGAAVWPAADIETENEDPVQKVIREREQSAFTWFLKSCIKFGDLKPSMEETLYLLCHSMAEEDPSKMRRHVTSTMIHLGRSYEVMGPVFVRLRKTMTPFWTRPQPLKYLCKRKIRKTLGPKRIANGLEGLLPKSLRDYLQLQRAEL